VFNREPWKHFVLNLTISCIVFLLIVWWASIAEMLAAIAQVDPATSPLTVNPSGDPPNFVDPPSLAGTVFAVGLTFFDQHRLGIIASLHQLE
jgi:hypothetical protein